MSRIIRKENTKLGYSTVTLCSMRQASQMRDTVDRRMLIKTL